MMDRKENTLTVEGAIEGWKAVKEEGGDRAGKKLETEQVKNWRKQRIEKPQKTKTRYVRKEKWHEKNNGWIDCMCKR